MATDDSLIRTLLIVIAVILLLPVLMMALAMPMMGVWGGGHMWNGWMWDGGMWDGTGATWMWLLMSIVPLLVILGLGYLLYSAVSRSETRGTDPALEELRAAYARGDLTDEEFEERRERLRRDR